VSGDWPQARVLLACQAGAEQESGWRDEDLITLPAGTRITVTSLLFSRWGWRVLRWRPDAVVIQWWHPAGHGHEAVDRAALLLQPRGFHVVTADGRRQWVPIGRRLARPIGLAARRLAGAGVVIAIGVAAPMLAVSAWWLRRRERQRMNGAI
jgi:hypothetical protein